MEENTILGRTNARSNHRQFGIRPADRLFHTYIVGKTGSGKSTLLLNQIYQDIQANRGFSLIDPHGDLAAKVTDEPPARKSNDQVYFDVSDPASAYGYNPLKRVPPSSRSLVASGIIETLHKLHDNRSWGVKMEHILRNVLLTLLDQQEADFSDIPKILLDKRYRYHCIRNIQNSEVTKFWELEYNKYHHFQRINMISPVLNKVGAFLSNPILKRALVDNQQQVSFRRAMDDGKIVVVNLSKGTIGEDASMLLGGLLINAVGLAAFSRADTPEKERQPYMVYVDEFQSFTTLSIANMLSELRKYAVGMVLANQFLSQLKPEIRDSVLGNVGTIISFRLGVGDAKYMEKEFYPVFSFSDLTSLANYDIYLKLMIDGMPSKPFSATTNPDCSSMRHVKNFRCKQAYGH